MGASCIKVVAGDFREFYFLNIYVLGISMVFLISKKVKNLKHGKYSEQHILVKNFEEAQLIRMKVVLMSSK